MEVAKNSEISGAEGGSRTVMDHMMRWGDLWT